MTTQSKIDYEGLTQEAMRGVVKAVLKQVCDDGLPGDHHFYISFDTTDETVGVSKRLKAKYPQEMTIVLQHRFWDLAVFDDRFEVKLTFDGIPERLVIPFKAIKVFFDPSVRYGLQFEEAGFTSQAIEESMADQGAPHDGESDNSDDASIHALARDDRSDDNAEADAAPKKVVGVSASSESDDEKPDTGAEIVSLDAFRKK